MASGSTGPIVRQIIERHRTIDRWSLNRRNRRRPPRSSTCLNNGVEIPQLGFGVFQIKPADTAAAVTEALKVGYRHIDTAEMYGNEKEVGQAIAAVRSRPGRGVRHQQAEQRLPRLRRRPARLRPDPGRPGAGEDRPVPDPLAAAGGRRLRRYLAGAGAGIYADGKARAIGVSNFQAHHLRRLHEETTVRPAVNQIEVHPYLTQEPTCAPSTPNTKSPPRPGRRSPRAACWTDPVITEIARSQSAGSPAQVVLRWHIQLGNIVFPKSTHAEPGAGELRDLRLRAVRRRHRADLGAEQGRADRPEPGRVQLDPQAQPR